MRTSGISLANKCQLLFGFAIVVILAGALSVPWIRAAMMVRESQVEVARQLVDAWLADHIQLGSFEGQVKSSAREAREEAAAKEPATRPGDGGGTRPDKTETAERPARAAAAAEAATLALRLVRVEDIESKDEKDRFLAGARTKFTDDPKRTEVFTSERQDGRTVYRYARAIRESQLRAVRDRSVAEFFAGAFDPSVADPLRAILVVDRTSPFAEGQLLLSRVFIITAGIVATALAGLVFHFILTKLIFSPVRKLRQTTSRVQAGDVSIRSTITTGDEFQQLSEEFNSMLDRLQQGQAQLKAMNESLDLKVNELAEANVGLYESNRFKSEFLATISHELRTPLNSIIGFAELLEEAARADAEPDPRKLRYLSNILTSGRSLLDMINELLDMAKIEAGRVEVNIEPTSVGDLIEGLAGIMRPQADAKQITLRLPAAVPAMAGAGGGSGAGGRLPTIETDPGKLQQILYNFLSNAIKFTPVGGSVTITADRVTRQDNTTGVRIGVTDTGPGIPYDMQELIFEKFRQLDASHTRQHSGTGLGLAICKELAQLLHASVSFVSEPEKGATFYVDLPLTFQPAEPQALMA